MKPILALEGCAQLLLQDRGACDYAAEFAAHSLRLEEFSWIVNVAEDAFEELGDGDEPGASGGHGEGGRLLRGSIAGVGTDCCRALPARLSLRVRESAGREVFARLQLPRERRPLQCDKEGVRGERVGAT